MVNHNSNCLIFNPKRLKPEISSRKEILYNYLKILDSLIARVGTPVKKITHSRSFGAGKKPTFSKKRRAFSIVEVAASIVIIGIISGVVTLALSQAQYTSQKLRYENNLRSILNSLAVQISSQPYQSLADGSFTRPSACSIGGLSSCLTIRGESVEIIWQSIEHTNPDYVTLTGQTIVNNDTTLKISKVVIPSPNSWNSGSGTLNLNISGVNYTSPIYLMDSGNKILASGIPTNSTLSLQLSNSLCTNNHPCFLALTPNGSFSNSGYTLDASNALGASSKIVYSGGDLDIDVRINTISKLTLDVSAINGDGRQEPPSKLNTLCLVLKFNDSVTDRYVTKCNSIYPNKIVFDRFTPNLNKPNIELGIPSNANYSILSDIPGKKCSNPGLSFYVNSWTPKVDECLSYTWGNPSSITKSSSIYPFTNNSFTYPTSDETLGVLYSSEAYPASGFTGDSLWAYPRLARSCALSSTCLPTTENLEVTKCANTYCLSSKKLAPLISGPLLGSNKLLSLYSTNSTGVFALNLRNPGANSDSTTTITLKKAPDNAQLIFNGNYLGDNQVITTFTGAAYTLSLDYTALQSRSYSNITIELKDNDSISTTTIPLSSVSVPYKANPIVIDAKQSTTKSLRYAIIGTDGEFLSGVSLQSQDVNSISLTNLLNSDSSGEILISAALASPLSGYRSVNATFSKNYSGTNLTNQLALPVLIAPGLSALKISVTKLTVKGTATASASATDFSGNPLPDQLIDFTSSSGSGSSYINFKPSSCLTDSLGTCSVLAVADLSAPPGSYTLTASSEGISDSKTISLEARASIFNLSTVRLLQNSSTKAVLLLADATGAPLPSQSVNVTLPTGLSVVSSGPSDSKGKVTLTFTASAQAEVGVNRINISAGALEQDFTVLVQPKISKISLSDLNLRDGTSLPVQLYAYDINDKPAAYADITITPYGLIAPLIIKTDKNGRALFSISNGLIAQNIHTLTFSANSEIIEIFNVNVISGSIDFNITSDLVPNSANQDLVVSITNNGSPYTNLKVKLIPVSKTLSVVSDKLTTNSLGQVTFKVNLSPRATGYVKFDIEFDSQKISKSVWIKHV